MWPYQPLWKAGQPYSSEADRTNALTIRNCLIAGLRQRKLPTHDYVIHNRGGKENLPSILDRQRRAIGDLVCLARLPLHGTILAM